jgi:hypothetical protein
MSNKRSFNRNNVNPNIPAKTNINNSANTGGNKPTFNRNNVNPNIPAKTNINNSANTGGNKPTFNRNNVNPNIPAKPIKPKNPYLPWLKKFERITGFIKNPKKVIKMSNRVRNRFLTAKFFKYRKSIGLGKLPPQVDDYEDETLKYHLVVKGYYAIRKLRSSFFKHRYRRFRLIRRRVAKKTKFKKKRIVKRPVFRFNKNKLRPQFHSMQSMVYPIIPFIRLREQKEIEERDRFHNLANLRVQMDRKKHKFRKETFFASDPNIFDPKNQRDSLAPIGGKFLEPDEKKADHLKIRPYSMIMPWLDFAQIQSFVNITWPRIMALALGFIGSNKKLRGKINVKQTNPISLFSQDIALLAWDRASYYKYKRFVFAIRNTIYKRFYNGAQIRQGVFGKQGLDYALHNYGQMFVFLFPLLNIFKLQGLHGENTKFHGFFNKSKAILKNRSIKKYKSFFKQFIFSVSNFARTYTELTRNSFNQYAISTLTGLSQRTTRFLNEFNNSKFEPSKTFSMFFDLRSRLKFVKPKRRKNKKKVFKLFIFRNKVIQKIKSKRYLKYRCRTLRLLRTSTFRSYLPLSLFPDSGMSLNFYELFDINILGPISIFAHGGHTMTNVFGFAPYAKPIGRWIS